MREEVEFLEDHAGLESQVADLLVVLPAPGMQRVCLDRDVADAHRARGRLLQEVEAAQHRRLAAPGAPDEHDRLVLADLQVHAAQDMVGAEILLDAVRLDYDVAGFHQRSPFASRFSRRAWKYEKMMVSPQYTRAAMSRAWMSC